MQMPEQSDKKIPSFSGEEAGSSSAQPTTHALAGGNIPAREQHPAEKTKPELYSEEDILKGLVYPPPPSFYENIPSPAEPKTTRQVPPPRSIPEATQPATSSLSPKIAPSATTPSAGTHKIGPSTLATQPAVKKSRTWIWVVAAIMGMAFIISCSLCGWVVYGPISKAFQEAIDAQNTINAYYSDLQARNYTHAYTYLALDGTKPPLTQATFVQQALQQDTQFGPILSYTPNTPSFSTDSATQGTDITQSTVTIQVGRKQKQYTVTLKLHREGNLWKIVEYNEL
jgi:hypothetical protein